MPATAAADVLLPDTRQRILRAALRLFRKHGYHGVGINDILAEAEAPKGSMYHHFPGGKEAIGVEVVALLARSIVGMIEAQPSQRAPAQVVLKVGAQLAETLARTRHELCALFAAFVAERDASPLLAQAVAEGYGVIIQAIAQRLQAAGTSRAAAQHQAQLVVMLLEGGSLLAAAQGDIAPFKLAVKHAAAICEGQ
jgi:TetR/AcrR family transcriptional repressor of lmrAB and yxaGH operons